MAKSELNLPIYYDQECFRPIEPRLSHPDILFIQRSLQVKGSATGYHDHSYCHMDIFLNGLTLFDLTNGESRRLRGGEAVVIGSGLEHRFRYAQSTELISVKFGWSDPSLSGSFRLLGGESAKRLRLVGEELDRGPRGDYGHLNYLLLWLLAAVRNREGGRKGDLLSRINAYKEEISRGMTVAELARELGYTPSGLSTKFSRTCGGTLKEHLDRIRADRAGQLLGYTDSSVGEVARELGFPDIYSFSRFYLRVAGVRPSRVGSVIDAAGAPAGTPGASGRNGP